MRESDKRDPLLGQVLGGKYRVKRVLGKGGFGSVYEAMDEMLGASVAIKVLNAEAGRFEDSLEQFRYEAQLLTNLNHQNIVRWITFDRTPEGLHYFVMEYLPGEELSDVLKREGSISPQATSEILLQILSALEEAHNLAGGGALYHLDLKPQNVFVLAGSDPEQPRIKVIDFGIGQHVGAEARTVRFKAPRSVADLMPGSLDQTIGTRRFEGDWGKTPVGVRRARGGTLLYASPEQCKHLNGDEDIADLDGRSDIYSLGILGFQLVTGEFPFAAPRNAAEAILNHLTQPPRRASDTKKGVPRRLSIFLNRCLKKDPAERWQSAQEARAALEAIVHPKPLFPKIVIAGLVLALGFLWFLREEPTRTFDLGQDELFLGTEGKTARLSVTNLGLEEVVAARVIRDPAAPEDVSGFAARWIPAGADDSGGASTNRIEVRADSTAKTQTLRAYLLLEGADGSHEHSSPLRLHFLGPDASELKSLDFRPAFDKSVLDPAGRRLEVVLEDRGQLDAPAIRRVFARWKGTRELDLSKRGSSFYELSLGDLLKDEREPTTGTLELLARDAAGAVSVLFDRELQIDPRPLTIDVALNATNIDGRYFITESGLQLACNANREGVRWEYAFLDEDREPVAFEQRGDPAVRLLVAKNRNFEGTLIVSASDDIVDHGVPERGRAKLQFPVSLSRGEAGMGVQLLRAKRPDPNGAYFVGDPHLTLELTRLKEAPMSCDVTIVQPDGQKRHLGEIVELKGVAADYCKLELSQPGLHRIIVEGFRLLGKGGKARSEEPATSHEVEVIYDAAPPFGEWQLAGAPFVMTRNPKQESFTFQLTDAPDEDSPVDLSFNVHTRSGQSFNLFRRKAVRPSGSPLELTWLDVLAELDHTPLDGTYELEVRGEDFAGHELEVVNALTFEVAVEGPRLKLEAPRVEGSGAWEHPFGVSVRAVDPNEVAAVRALVARDGEPLRPLSLDAPRASVDWRGNLGDLALPATWSHATVELVIEAEDRHGNASQLGPVEVLLGAVELVYPNRIAVSRDANASAYAGLATDELGSAESAAQRSGRAMLCLVEGNGGREYHFFGRDPDLEQRAFQSFGLQYSASRSEGRRIPADGIAPFYLDANEVTVREFIGFLQDPEGYSVDEHWPEGFAPRAERAATLLTRLAAEAFDTRPVTGVTWPEASAYAHWTGKRLPTHEEWEFAVRGATYRPFAGATPSTGRPTPASYNYDNRESGSPWPIDHATTDVTPEGIRSLCSNVSEWTSTAAKQAGSYVVVGGSYRSPHIDFRASEAYRTDQSAPHIGFRCAISAMDAIEARGNPETEILVEDWIE